MLDESVTNVPFRHQLLALLRLLLSDKEVFTYLIDIRKVQLLLRHSDVVVQFLATWLNAIYGRFADCELRSRLAVSDKLDVQMQVEDRILDLRLLGAYEHIRVRDSKRLLAGPQQQIRVSAEDIPRCILVLEDVYLFKQEASENKVSPRLVRTSTTRSNLRSIALSLNRSKACMLVGSSGAGKTLLIDHIANALGRREDVIRLHLSPQTDAKILLGTYLSSGDGGQFKWQPGTLTSAVQKGKILLIEDIDKAASDVLHLLMSLIEHRSLFLPSRDDNIPCPASFRIIATMSATDASLPISMTGARLFDIVHISPVKHDELRDLVVETYPLLANLLDSIMSTYLAITDEEGPTKGLNRSQTRRYNTRDLLKWCRRISKVFEIHQITSIDQQLDDSVIQDIFGEAVDCFAANVPNSEIRRSVGRCIGTQWHLSPEWVEEYLSRHEPSITDTKAFFQVGRSKIAKTRHGVRVPPSSKIALTAHAGRLLEQICVSVMNRESMLLVGETGTGKTTMVQYAANRLGKNLLVLNLSQQTEASDLLGNFKPQDPTLLALPILETFEPLFASTLKSSKNSRYLIEVRQAFTARKWARFSKLIRGAINTCRSKHSSLADEIIESDASRKKRKLMSQKEIESWSSLSTSLDVLDASARDPKSFAFQFVEGNLIRAMKAGDWVLLDEINLASSDTLESLTGLLADHRSLLLSERGDTEPIIPHPDFRIFACMNPATDYGKRDLPSGIRSRFSEIYVGSPDEDRDDLLLIIHRLVGEATVNDMNACTDIAILYSKIKALVESRELVDAANQKPHYSIRTLSRALWYTSKFHGVYGLRRTLYEAFSMCYLTLLDHASEKTLDVLLRQYTVDKLSNAASVLRQIPAPPGPAGWVQLGYFWLAAGSLQCNEDIDYILTPSVEHNLSNLVRAASASRYPILLQGPTSSGKTSMVQFLAARTGHEFIRINNHEHTDLDEYVGSYVSNSAGRLVYLEGLLIKAMREGHWLVLDELNLAPPEVLEALNRLLDDNREFLVPETQEVIKPHPHFQLFATQNPAGLYGGRKHLSRAFRNRFLEIHFNDIPIDELETIISRRCKTAPSYCRRIVQVYQVRDQLKALLTPRNSQFCDSQQESLRTKTASSHYETCFAGQTDRFPASKNWLAMVTAC